VEILNKILDISWQAFLMTTHQIVGYFAGVFIFGILLYLLARFTRNMFAKSFGDRSEIIITAWIGTPVHELGHAFFCILFGHSIKRISLFRPNAKDGTLGYVEHSYDPRNIYHLTGNFFIGAGPVFFGSAIILGLLYFLLPDGKVIISQFRANSAALLISDSSFYELWNVLQINTREVFSQLAKSGNFSMWQFWVFLYVSMAVSAHIELSPPDIFGMLKGLLVIVVLFFLINVIYVVFFGQSQNFINKGIPVFSYFNQVFVLALIFSFLNFLISFILGNLWSLIRNQSLVNPFTR
jgi:hypothetical protein